MKIIKLKSSTQVKNYLDVALEPLRQCNASVSHIDYKLSMENSTRLDLAKGKLITEINEGKLRELSLFEIGSIKGAINNYTGDIWVSSKPICAPGFFIKQKLKRLLSELSPSKLFQDPKNPPMKINGHFIYQYQLDGKTLRGSKVKMRIYGNNITGKSDDKYIPYEQAGI